MQYQKFSCRLVAVVISLLLAHIVPYGSNVAAQDKNRSIFDEVPTVKNYKPKIKRWRKPPPPRPVKRTPLLALQLRLYKLREDGSQVETSPNSQFFAGDRLRLGVITNQKGYLTIIRQPGPEQDGETLFPTSLLNDGGNYVPPYKEFIVPSNCPANIDPRDCAYVVPETAGRELFTIIFSRRLILNLPANARTDSGLIKSESIKDIEGDSVKRLDIRPGRSPYALLVVNTNRQDNEEIFTRFEIINKGPSQLRR